MVKGCGVLVLLCCIHQSLSAATSTSPAVKTQNDHDDSEAQEFEPDHEFYQDHWLQKLLEYTRRDLRSADKDNMFWATRGKRNPDIEDFWAIRGKKSIKPNGLFQTMSAPGKRGLKPNGLFGTIKRAGLKPNSLFNAYKRSMIKPNGLFGAFKRPALKPNGLFGAFKRSALKPNGLFSSLKRAGLKPNGLFGAYKRADEHENFVDDDYFDEEDLEFLNELLEDDLEEDDNEMEKRADFWAARGKKEDAHFWATRG